jgi:ABC-type Fe3+/spermidine/putrescine transport system ATPase subunit
MCFQNYALWPHLTVFDNVAYGLKLKRVKGLKYTKSAIGKRVDAALELVRLGGLGGRHIHQLSGGQQQRVALARALVIEPDVLLLDEPLSNLDAKLRVEMREEIIRIQKEMSITTIYVTHDQVEALSISDRVAVMDIGYVQQFDTPRKIYADPQTIFVADFIGRCTFVQGKVEKIGEFIEVRLPDGQSLSGFSTIDNYPFEVGEDVKCAIRPENLMLKRADSQDNKLAGTVTKTTYVGTALEVFFDIGGTEAQARLDADIGLKSGDAIKLYASRSEVMVLPLGGVHDLRKVPGHPMASAEMPTKASSSA